MNIYQRINAVRKAIGYIQKDKSVSTGGGSYKAVTHDAVTGMIRQHLIEQGIVIVPSQTTGVFHQKEPEAKQRLYEASYVVRFVNEEKPDDFIEVNVFSHALDNGDKAPGKAISYATKYAMLKLFSIETGDDEESRYQQEEFDLEGYLSMIRECTNMDELRKAYGKAYGEATNIRDKDAQKRIISEKDKRKKEIEKIETAGQA